MVAAGLRDERIATIAGKAATQPMEQDPMDPRNRRVAITLLRNLSGR
jgi:flagellar motor protein MotB